MLSIIKITKAFVDVFRLDLLSSLTSLLYHITKPAPYKNPILLV